MAPKLGGTQAYTGNDLNGFNTVGQEANVATNPTSYNLMNGVTDNEGIDGFTRMPFGGFFIGLAVFVGSNNHIAGNHEVNFYKITAKDNYATKEKIASLTVIIPPNQRGFFWSNADTLSGTRFWRANDNIGIEVQKVGGVNATGISNVTVTAVYDFVENI